MPDKPSDQKMQSRDVFVSRGTKGLERFGGRVAEEWLRRLHGERGMKVFREMADNDDIVGAVLFAIEQLLRNVDWRVQQYSDDALHVEQAEFLESVMEDMAATWEDTMAEVLSMLTYGYAPLEINYKRREGPYRTEKHRRSKHSDGRIGWRELAIRAQPTIDRWVFDEDGDVIGLVQVPVEIEAGKPREIPIPAEKLLLFRTTSRKSNPEGRSILRNAFVSWFYKKRIQESEAIGIERDLAGMPIFWLPQPWFDPNADNETKANLAEYRRVVENIKNDEQSGLLLPLWYDENGNKMLNFELAGAGAGTSKRIDTDKIVRRYNRAIAQTVLADFILLGQDATGSYALSADKTELFQSAVQAILSSIAAVLNRQGVARLYVLNGWNPAEAAEFVPGSIEDDDMKAFAETIGMLTDRGWLTPGGEEDEEFFRNKMGMPDKPDDAGLEPPEGSAGGLPQGSKPKPGQQKPEEEQGGKKETE